MTLNLISAMQSTNAEITGSGCEQNGPILPVDSVQRHKPVIVGLYGIPGSGKSFLLNVLKQGLSKEEFNFYEGSQVIANVTPGGLEAFQELPQDRRKVFRELAVHKIKQEALDSGKTAIVAGHAMFWAEGGTSEWVCTSVDLLSFTHIVYLDVPAASIADLRLKDKEKRRPEASVAHLKNWQAAEIEKLRRLCRCHYIVFLKFPPRSDPSSKLISLFRNCHRYAEQYNTRRAEQMIDETLLTGSERSETVLVLDADKTLAPQDSGDLFWEELYRSLNVKNAASPLKEIFSSPLQYSFTAFCQAAILYEETVEDEEYNRLCEKVAHLITMHQELLHILRLMSGQTHMRAFVLTCGLRRVWQMVIENEGLSHTVQVIGGNRLSDCLFMTPKLKEDLVMRIRSKHGCYVWAFGDSPLDLGMLKAANQAVVVTGEQDKRSKSMDAALSEYLKEEIFCPRQAVLPSHASPRLDLSRLPLIQLSDQVIFDSIFIRRNQLHIFDVTNSPAAKLLMTPMRDASISGPELREAHRRVGWYLAIHCCTEIMGVEPFTIRHVQGYPTDGHRIFREKDTLIAALMRGGEPMALGVNDAFPSAKFLHVKNPGDISPKHLSSIKTVILVDSVINSGKSILKILQHIRMLDSTVRIVAIAGVIQSQTLSKGTIAQELSRLRNISFISLRQSENQFVGKGGTDTGNRLFNTTSLS